MAYAKPPFASSISQSASSSSENAPFDRGQRNSAPGALQPMVSSASALPGQNKQSLSLEQLVEHYRSFRVSQHKLHDEERKFWEREKTDLHNRIQQLEEIVSSLLYKNGTLSPPTSGGLAASGFGTFPPYQPQSSTSTGREVWRGPETQTTRTFSDSSETSSKATVGRLASIPETAELAERKKSVGFSEQHLTHRSSSIPGSLIHPNYDGITLKTNLLPPEALRTVVESPSPLQSPSPRTNPATPPSKPTSEPKPKLIDVPRTRLNSEALYTQDAGHTPLAYVTGEDSQLPSPVASPNPKPLEIPIEVEQPPYEPAPSVRPPKERADSYFPIVHSATTDGASMTNEEQKENIYLPDAPADDPALKGPLSLSSSNTKSGDANFLDKVNSELEHQATTMSSSVKQFSFDGPSETSYVRGDGGKEMDERERDKEKVKEQERRDERDKDRNEGRRGRDRADSEPGEDSDGGPKLRIKRSMNFGAPLGKGL